MSGNDDRIVEILQIVKGNMSPDDSLLTARQVSEKLSVTVDSIWKYSKAGWIPKPVRLGSGSTRWKRSEINTHIASLKPDI